MNTRHLLIMTGAMMRRPYQCAHAFMSTRGNPLIEDNEHIRLASAWLLSAQKNCPDGDGYSRRFSLAAGWDRGYVETTGYIIPTLFNVASYLGDDKLKQSALKAGEWLLTVQKNNGAFAEIDNDQPMVFDTGQVMLGLNHLWRETGDRRYLEAAKRAAIWLCDVQDDDGAWRRYTYNAEPHSYYSRVGAALAETGTLAEESRFVEAGRRNLNWTLAQELPNSWFEHCSFRAGEPALLHTMAYVLEGLLLGAEVLGESCYKEAALRGARAILRLCDEEDLPRARYYSNWRSADSEFCATGLAQYARICFEMERIASDEGFAEAGNLSLQRLCSWQCRIGKDIKGALPSSVPLWGSYGCMAFYNWNVKFFLDAMMERNVKRNIE